MSASRMGAVVQYCGHRGVFVADIHAVGNVNVVRGNGPINGDMLLRDDKSYESATHHLSDFPSAGYWDPRVGVFVVPSSQVTELPRKQTKTTRRKK